MGTSAHHSPRVLLIERDPRLADALARYMRVAGFDVAHAADLNSAVRMLRGGEAVAAILVDDLTVGPGWLPHVRAAARGAQLILASFTKQGTTPEISGVLLKPYRASAVVELLSTLGHDPAAAAGKQA